MATALEASLCSSLETAAAIENAVLDAATGEVVAQATAT
jgi:hypothetical protein